MKDKTAEIQRVKEQQASAVEEVAMKKKKLQQADEVLSMKQKQLEQLRSTLAGIQGLKANQESILQTRKEHQTRLRQEASDATAMLAKAR